MAEKRKTGKMPGAGKSKPAAKRKAAPGEIPLKGPAAEAEPPGDIPPQEAEPAEALAGADQRAAAPPPRRVKRGADLTTLAIWAVGVAAVLAGAGYATRPFWTPYVEAALSPLLGEVPPPSGRVPPPATDDQAIAALEAERTRFSAQLNDLMRQVETLERSIADVRRMVAATDRPAADANQSLERLSQRLADLEHPGGGREDLLRRIAKLEASVPGEADAAPEGTPVSKEPADAMAKARATIEAVQRLRRVVGEAAPYVGEFSALRDLAGADTLMSPAMADLEPYRATGIPTLAALRARFDDVAGAMAAAARAREGDDWTDRVFNRLASLVRVRRTGASAAEGTVDGAIAGAEKALRTGDLKAALETLDGLDGAAAEEAAEWMAGARARVTAERALAALHVHAVALLTPARDD